MSGLSWGLNRQNVGDAMIFGRGNGPEGEEGWALWSGCLGLNPASAASWLWFLK